MYSFDPTEEQRMLMDAAKRYATNDLRPAAHDADEAGVLPAALIEKGWELGVLQASIPEAYGGFGEHSTVTGVLAAEELAYGDMAAALAVMAPGMYAIPILLGGSEAQKEALLPGVVEAGWKPYTAAFIEPRYDFCPGEMQTTANRRGEGFVLDGVKTMVPFADKAEGMIVYAAVDGKPQAFRVSPKADGVRVGEREKLLGLGAIPMFRVTFESVKVPEVDWLGGGHDPAPLLAATQVAVAALAVGLSRAAYEYTLNYAKERTVFGVPIAQKQSIAFGLAEMVTEIEAIRLLVWEAAWLLDAGKDASREAYLALTGASDAAMMVTDRAVQYLGGHGYIREHPVERWMRCGRGVATFPGLAMV